MAIRKQVQRTTSPAQTGQREQYLFELAERFRSSDNSEEVKKLGDELGRIVFGG